MADTDVTDSPFLTLALSRWRASDTHEGPMRTEGQTDLEFLNLQQWDADIVRERGDNRPALTIDQIGEPYRQILGQLRKAQPSIQINPVDNGADIDTAEVYQGLYRHIEQTGHAKIARDEASKGMVGPGWGYYRLLPEFEYDQEPKPGPDGGFDASVFDQCITYQAIENQFTVFWDPACPLHEPWKARFCFVIEDIPKDEFKARYPGKAATSIEAFAATGVAMPDWYPETSVRVADYFYVEEKDGAPLALLANGRVVPLKDAPAGVAILQQRTPKIRTVKLAKITGAEILEGNEDLTAGRDVPCDYIPVIPMYGESLVVNGKRTLRGMVRPARDPQRSYNYQVSELVYELALAPKSKVIMAEGQDEGYEDQWKTAATVAHATLKYKPTALGGERVPEPTVAHFTDSTKIQALSVAINQFKADLRTTTGWYDATDPNRKNADQSGRAILARQESQKEGVINWGELYGRALTYEAMCVISMIPRLYNRVGRVLRIVGMEGDEQEEVVVGQPRKGQQRTARGVQGVFQWGAGRYDIVASLGVAYATKRQEASTTQLELIKVLAPVNPAMAAAIVPTAIRNMDIPGAQDLAEIANRTLPPEIRGEEGDEQDPQVLQAKVTQAQQMLQERDQVIQGLQQAIQTDQVKAEADIQKEQMKAQADAERADRDNAAKYEIESAKIASDERIAAAKIQADYQLAQLKIDADIQKARITARAQDQARREGFAHDDMAGELEHQRAQETAASGNGAGA